MANLGFVGVGNMGGHMAPRLAQRQHVVTAYDKNDAVLKAAVEAGCKSASSATDVANAAETVFVSLPTPDIVQNVVLNEIAKGSKVKNVVDVSTTGPKVAALVAKELKAKGITYVDAPVSGGMA